MCVCVCIYGCLDNSLCTHTCVCVCSVFAGILIGNIFWGPVADAVGRRRGFIIGTSVCV
jgi:MFS family permease